MNKKMAITLLVFFTCLCGLFAGEISLSDSAAFNITSRTSFGVDLDNPYRYGLKQELTTFELVIGLVPYQKLSNRVNSSGAVGFIDFTLFHLDLLFSGKVLGYNAPGNATTNRYQTGEFIAGIAKGNWVFQLNAAGNEPFWSPWNKGIQFTNDKVKFTWAYLDSMVDVKRVSKVSELKPQDPVVTQFQQDGPGSTDKFGLNLTGATVAALYNKEDVFGLNLKFATEFPYDSESISKHNKNGIAAGVDAVITPPAVNGLKIFASAGGSYQYGPDANSDPVVFGTKIGYTVPLNADISVEPYAGTDIGIKFKDGGGTDPVEFEVSGGLTMRWPGQGGWYTDYILEKEGRVFPGMSLAYCVYGTSDAASSLDHRVKFTLFEPRGDEGLFYKLGSEIIADATNLGKDDWQLLGTFYFDYEMPGFAGTMGTLVPWTIICYDNYSDSGSRKNGFKTDIGVKLENAISNTTFGIAWNTGDLLAETPVLGYLKLTAEVRF
ncbi:hypothetical protein [Treponema brennaborense]|uniref:Uncharacterized protein n=1 Tax=Treponema brennaborense (strain DSM 12168 / CIP 105900 / DD5/3) TaxID=906968 RepID=F4LLU5_TREBD|nr:hypothetical protein [Treponema brennaborense]AEE15637.1 hypothetical protein Trebr_0186 [Treponema brennaborense DSM 12168]